MSRKDLAQTAVVRAKVPGRFNHISVSRTFPARVVKLNPANLTVDVGLALGGNLKDVPVIWAAAGYTHGKAVLPRIGDLVLVSFGSGSPMSPLVVGSVAEPVPQTNELLPLFNREDLAGASDPSDDVSKAGFGCPTCSPEKRRHNFEAVMEILDATWTPLATTKDGEPNTVETDLWLEAHPAGNFSRMDERGNVGQCVEGNLGLMIQNGGAFVLRQSIRPGRDLEGEVQFEFFVDRLTGEVLFVLDPKSPEEKYRRRAVMTFRAERGVLVSTNEEDTFPPDTIHNGYLYFSGGRGLALSAGFDTDELEVRMPGGRDNEDRMFLSAKEGMALDTTGEKPEAGEKEINLKAQEKITLTSKLGDIEVESELQSVLVTALQNFIATATAGDAKLVATAGGILLQALVGNIEAQATAGDIKATATAGDIDVKATAGDISIEATAQDITLKAPLGTINEQALTLLKLFIPLIGYMQIDSIGITITVSVGSLLLTSLIGPATLSAGTIVSINAGGSVAVNAPLVGVTAGQMYVAASQISLGGAGPLLRLLTEAFIGLFNAHVHTCPHGGTTSAPVTPITVAPPQVTTITTAT